MIQSMADRACDAVPAQLNSLTLSPRGVLIAHVPEHTGLDIMEGIRNYL